MDTILDNVDKGRVESLMECTKRNVGYFDEAMSGVVKAECESLDNLMRDLYAECVGKKDEVPVSTLESYYLELSNMVYFMQEKVERLGVYSDMAGSAAKEVYSKSYAAKSGMKDALGKSKSTVAELQALANLDAQYESVVASIYDHAYKVIRNKVDSAKDMMNALRRIISTRTAEMQLSMGASDYKGNGGSKWNN